MVFKDRIEASKLLAERLRDYKGRENVVIAVPRCGVVLGFYVAGLLELPLEIVLTKKLGHPFNKEFAIGAVSLQGVIINEDVSVAEDYINEETWRIRKILKERYKLYMGQKQPSSLAHKTVIIVDDGVATGSTMDSTVELVKRCNPLMVLVAVPVGSPRAIAELRRKADELICLQTPDNFYAVGQFYENFAPVSDDDVIYLMKKAHSKNETVH